MKWLTKVPPPEPMEGDERDLVFFTIIPRRCLDGYTRVFEKIKVHERLERVEIPDGHWGYGTCLRWIEKYAEGIQ